MSDKTKIWLKANAIRAGKTFYQSLIGSIPATFVITPAMIQYFNISCVYIILAWIANALLTTFVCFASNRFHSLPEVELMTEDIPDEIIAEEEDENIEQRNSAD